MTKRDSTLRLGVLGRPHGIRGELSLHPYNTEGGLIEDLDLPVEVELERGEERLTRTLRTVRATPKDYLVTFEGVTDRDVAASLTNTILLVPRAVVPPLEEGEFYLDDLVGCAVFDGEGRPRGTVRGVFWNGAHDVLTVVDEQGAELLIPAVDDFLTELDLDGRRIVVDPHE